MTSSLSSGTKGFAASSADCFGTTAAAHFLGSKSNADSPTTNSTATGTTSPCTKPHTGALTSHRRQLGVGPARGLVPTARTVDIPTSWRRPRHRDPRAGPIGDVAIEHALAGGLPLADALARADGADAVVPEELHRLGETTGYHVAVTWGAQPGTWMPSSPIDPHRRHTPPLTDLKYPGFCS